MPLKTHIDEPPTLNLTAMIDILFLLIIFFMVSTQFTEYERSLGSGSAARGRRGRAHGDPRKPRRQRL